MASGGFVSVSASQVISPIQTIRDSISNSLRPLSFIFLKRISLCLTIDFYHFSPDQVGTYFLRQYYHVLQKQPELGHQFYADLSTVMHIDRDESHTASGMMVVICYLIIFRLLISRNIN